MKRPWSHLASWWIAFWRFHLKTKDRIPFTKLPVAFYSFCRLCTHSTACFPGPVISIEGLLVTWKGIERAKDLSKCFKWALASMFVSKPFATTIGCAVRGWNNWVSFAASEELPSHNWCFFWKTAMILELLNLVVSNLWRTAPLTSDE